MMIDIIFLLLLLVAIMKGLQRGLVVAVFSFLGVMIGLAAAIKLSAVVAGQVKDFVRISPKWLPILSFILVFILVVILVRWCANLIQAAMNLAMLGWANKIGGVILYAILFTAVYSIFLFYGSSAHVLSPQAISASVTYKFIRPWGPEIIDGMGKLIPFFKDMFQKLEDFFGHLSNQVR